MFLRLLEAVNGAAYSPAVEAAIFEALRAMPYTKKQKRVACAIAHGAKLKRVKMPKKVAEEMCRAPIKKKRKAKKK